MELRHLRYFVVVAEELHFRRAAERLHMSQPPLSQQIRALEEEVGATLLLRNQRKVELTAAGAAFLERAREILAAVEDAALEARRVQRGEVGRLAIGFVGSAMYSFVPELLRALPRAATPTSRCACTSSARPSSCASSRTAGSTSASCACRSRGPSCGSETVLEEPVIAALPDLHPLAAQPHLRPRGPRGPAARPAHALRRARACARRWRRAIDVLGGEDVITQEVAEMQTVIGLVAAGAGISLVPESVRALMREGVTYRPLDDEAPAVRLEMAWRRCRMSRRVLAAFSGSRWRARRPLPKEREVGRGRQRYVDAPRHRGGERYVR